MYGTPFAIQPMEEDEKHSRFQHNDACNQRTDEPDVNVTLVSVADNNK